MLTSVSPGLAVSGYATTTDYRPRPPSGASPITPQAAPPAQEDAAATGQQNRKNDAEAAAARARDLSENYASAVIEGRLAPTPQSADEVFRRIGTSSIPAESQARIMDFFA